MIEIRQKFLLHHYARAAGLSDAAYRDILRKNTGCVSAADPAFSQAGFDSSMAALETVLFDRVDRGVTPNPLGLDRYILSPDYWRRRTAGARAGLMTTRQLNRIRSLWPLVADSLAITDPWDRVGMTYLIGIARKAAGRQVPSDLENLTLQQAHRLVDALQDRASAAIARQPAPQSHQPMEVLM